VEVICKVLQKEVKNPYISELITITKADITKDLRYAKIYFTVIGDETTQQQTLHALQDSSGFIAVKAAKKVRLKYFPELTFLIDHSFHKQLRIQELLHKVEKEEESR